MQAHSVAGKVLALVSKFVVVVPLFDFYNFVHAW